MSNNTCPVEPLVSSKYCHLSVCMECNIVHLNLPTRISFQYDLNHFLGLADAISRAAVMLRKKTRPQSIQGAKIIKLDTHH